MILNIDLGSLYVKVAVIDKKSKRLVTSEVIRLERDTLNVVEVLVTTIVDKYCSKFDVNKIHIIPNAKYIDCEIIEYESVIESKYQKIMKNELKRTLKEEKKKERMGSEYEPTKLSSYKLKYTPITFNRRLTGVEVFHQMEYKTLMRSDIYVEYVDSEYIKGLAEIIRSIEKEVILVSPIRALKYLPLPKKNRVVVNYGHKNILMVVIEVDKDGEEYIKEVVKETISETMKDEPNTLYIKHESSSPDNDPIYLTKLKDIRNLREKYKGYDITVVGGNSNFIQGDLLTETSIDKSFTLPRLPKVTENVLLPSLLPYYNDFPYNSLQMQVKNKVLNAVNLSSKATRTVMDVSGDIAVAGLILALVSSYHIHSKHLSYSNQLNNYQAQIEDYEGESGTIRMLETNLEGLKTGRTKIYYDMSELLDTLSSPLEIESLDIEGDRITLVAYADNMALVQQFLETVKARQINNRYTKFTLSEKDVTTVYQNGRRLDKVVFEGRMM